MHVVLTDAAPLPAGHYSLTPAVSQTLGTVFVLGLVLRCLYTFRDRNPGYTVALNIDGHPAGRTLKPFRVGFARVKISPDLSNTNEPIWLAGFNQNRAATRVHDDLYGGYLLS